MTHLAHPNTRTDPLLEVVVGIFGILKLSSRGEIELKLQAIIETDWNLRLVSFIEETFDTFQHLNGFSKYSDALNVQTFPPRHFET